jgi:hypothetical protein
MIALEIDPRGLAAVEAALVARPAQATRALVRAINKTLSWATSQGQRAIAAKHNIPLKALRARRRTAVARATSKHLSGRAWFGTAPIKAAYLGTPRQTKAGARVGRLAFAGAFVAPMPSGHVGIFRRLGTSRLPIVEEEVRLTAAEQALSGVKSQLAERLQTVFFQEMNYETNVKRR